MRIRLKLSVVELTTAFGFIAAISISLFYMNSMIRVKNMEYQAERVVSSLSRLGIQTEGLLISAKILSALKNDWNESVLQFETELDLLKKSGTIGFPGSLRSSELSSIDTNWKRIYYAQMDPIRKHLEFMISLGLEERFGSRGILDAFYSMGSDNSEYSGIVFGLKGFRDNAENEILKFTIGVNNFITELKEQSSLYIRKSFQIVAILVILTIIISVQS